MNYIENKILKIEIDLFILNNYNNDLYVLFI
jgi:hypothetical protein